MSVISLRQVDRSDLLCKRYASLVSSYIDHPEHGRTTTARVPLENLFRVLQMLRYEAFSDERRNGVLALEGFPPNVSLFVADEQWHEKIQQALTDALSDAFANTEKEEAISEVESTLRWLASGSPAPSTEAVAKSKRFFGRLLADL